MHDPAQPVDLPPNERGGLLTQPGFLAVHGHANQSAPVQRGKAVLRNVLCQALPSPPPSINTTPPDPSPDSTTRERFAVHERDPTCGGCHKRIDGIGMGFEHYDGIGGYRTHDGKPLVDATGQLLGTDVDGKFDGAVALGQLLASSKLVHDCVTTQWYRFALGRLEVSDDRCALVALQEGFAETNGDVRGLLLSIARSPAFRRKRAPTAASEGP
jgi:hypothetical protein